MNNLLQAIWVEALKVRRSRMPLLTALAMALLPLGGGFFMIVLRDPELARQAGLISTKAQITVGVADWPAYLGFLSSAMPACTIFFSFIASWVFGREFSDRTAKDLLALPTPRSAIVTAKLLIVVSWSAALAAWAYLVSIGVGTAIGLPQLPPGAVLAGSATFAVTVLLTIILVPPIAYFASAGHGYLAPMAVALLALGFAQAFAIAGWGEYFPWAIPALYAQGTQMGWASYAIVLLTGVAGIAGTLLWWELADHSR